MQRLYKPYLAGFAVGSLILVSAAAAVVMGQGGAKRDDRWAEPNTAQYQRIDIIETIQNSRKPKVGETAQLLDAKDEVGARFHLQRQLELKPVLLGAFCACEKCRETGKWWQKLLDQYPGKFQAAAIVAVPSGEPAVNFVDRLRLRFPIIPDPSHSLSAQFPGPGEGNESLGCPRAWVIGRDGKYRYVMPMGSVPTSAIQREIRRALAL